MKVVDFLRVSFNLLKFMSKNDLKANDYKHVAMYDDYIEMRNRGEKVEYILTVLSCRYHLSESTIKRVVKKFSKEVNS